MLYRPVLSTRVNIIFDMDKLLRNLVVVTVCGLFGVVTFVAWLAEPQLNLKRVRTSVKFHKWDQSSEELRRKESYSQGCTVSFAPHHIRPYTALASFPGSGNTWLRHLLELTTGIYTSSPYYDSTLFDGGFLGEGLKNEDGRTFIAKTHEFYPDKSGFRTAIVLIRNPFDAFIADYNRIKGDHVGFANSANFHGQKWYEYVTDAASAWEVFHTNWLKWNHQQILIQYEGLVSDTYNHVIKITQFLNLTIDEERSQCLKNNMEGRFHRPLRKPAITKEDVYSKRMCANINQKIEKVNELLVSRGLKPYDLLST